jgi:hypothetical protein
VDRLIDALDALGRRVRAGLLRHVERLQDPESMVGAFIMTVWSLLAGMWAGVWGILILLIIGWLLHIAAVESGNHVMLWLATAGLLVFVVLASATFFGGLPPVLLAAAGATALAHNELVRLNYARRRRAVVDDSAFHASGLGLTIVGAMAVVGVAIAEAVSSGTGNRSWLWMPVAVGALMAVGFALAFVPTLRATGASKERYQPGERIPPQPLAREEPEHF